VESREQKNLKKVIDQYLVENTQKQLLEKELKSKNAFIKSKLGELDTDIFETESNKAVITYQNRTSMDDDKCIEILRENCKEKDLKSIIKTKEYVDYDALESFIYNGGIDAVKLEPAQIIKVVTTLTVKPLKKEKKEDD